MSGLKPKSFHEEILTAMQDAGFVRLYRFKTSTLHNEYHVPAKYAQETSHFFYLPDRGFIFQAALAEHVDSKASYSSHWRIELYFALDIDKMLRYELRELCPMHAEPRWVDDECVPLSHVQGGASKILNKYTTDSCSLSVDRSTHVWSIERREDFTPGELAVMATEMAAYFEQFLLPKFDRLDAARFVNGYSWPGSGERFWRSFPSLLLNRLVVRPFYR